MRRKSRNRFCHKEKILSWNIPASDTCLRDDVYEYFIHSRIKYTSRIYISYSTHSLTEVRYLEIGFTFDLDCDRKRKIIFANILKIIEIREN